MPLLKCIKDDLSGYHNRLRLCSNGHLMTSPCCGPSCSGSADLLEAINERKQAVGHTNFFDTSKCYHLFDLKNEVNSIAPSYIVDNFYDGGDADIPEVFTSNYVDDVDTCTQLFNNVKQLQITLHFGVRYLADPEENFLTSPTYWGRSLDFVGGNAWYEGRLGTAPGEHGEWPTLVPESWVGYWIRPWIGNQYWQYSHDLNERAIGFSWYTVCKLATQNIRHSVRYFLKVSRRDDDIAQWWELEIFDKQGLDWLPDKNQYQSVWSVNATYDDTISTQKMGISDYPDTSPMTNTGPPPNWPPGYPDEYEDASAAFKISGDFFLADWNFTHV